MQENPYSGILSVISERAKGQIPVTFWLGKVTGVSPLKVSVSHTEQAGNDLLKNADIGELHSGDDVLLLPFDSNQKFIILCRVVGV